MDVRDRRGEETRSQSSRGSTGAWQLWHASPGSPAGAKAQDWQGFISLCPHPNPGLIQGETGSKGGAQEPGKETSIRVEKKLNALF